MDSEKYDLITLGRSCIDLYSQNVGAPFNEITGFDAFVGGSPLNIAVAASRLGINTSLLTAVGNDTRIIFAGGDSAPTYYNTMDQVNYATTGDATDFGDANTHAGKFVFQTDVTGNLKHPWTYPVAQVQAILNLDGQATMSLSDQGAMQITVDSGMGTYNYILPAQSK